MEQGIGISPYAGSTASAYAMYSPSTVDPEAAADAADAISGGSRAVAGLAGPGVPLGHGGIRYPTIWVPAPSVPSTPYRPSDTRDLVDVLRDLVARLERQQSHVQVPTWALAGYGQLFLGAPAGMNCWGTNSSYDLRFGMVEGTTSTLEGARRLMRERSHPSDSYTLGIVQVSVGDDTAYQVVRLNTERLEQRQEGADWRGLQTTRRHGDDTATLRLVETDQHYGKLRYASYARDESTSPEMLGTRAGAARRNG